MTTRSRFDELHDRFDSFRTTKAGTRYERLAAVVLKTLHEHATVVHDIKLVGDSEVKHQIDVTVGTTVGTRRLLVECKDFDVSGEPVGLPIIRNFFGVVEDTKPDDALVVTCSGFTEDARVYAKAKGIKLALLRTPHEHDWRRGPRAFRATIRLAVPTLLECKLNFLGTDNSVLAKWLADRVGAGLDPDVTQDGEPVFINGTEDGRVQFNDYVTKHVNLHEKNVVGPHEVIIPLRGMTAEVEERGGLPLDSLVLRMELRRSEGLVVRSVAHTVAALILETLGGSEAVVWEHDLRRFIVGADGVVCERLMPEHAGEPLAPHTPHGFEGESEEAQ